MSLSGPRDISFQNPTDNAKDTTTDTIGFKEDGNAIDRPQEREAKSDDISGVGETDSFQDEVGINRNNERHDSEEGLDRKEVVPDRDIEAPITEVKGLRLSESVHEPPLDSQSTVSPDLAHGCSGSVQEKERSPTPPPPPPKDAIYLDPTPKTPRPSAPPSRTPSHTGLSSQDPEKADVFQDGQSKITSGASSDVEFDEKRSMAHGRDGDADSRSEIQSIMDQFDEAGGGPGIEEVMSPRLELAGPLLGSPVQHPPRKSSLEPVKTENKTALHDSSSSPLLQSPLPEGTASFQRVVSRSMSPETSSLRRLSLLQPLEIKPSGSDTPVSPNPPSSLHKPPPPEPDPEPELPFDFHRFLEQLRHRTADPVAKFLRSFLSEFGKKQWMVHEQVKIISDFLAFITNKMAQCEVWQGVSDAEFDNAREGMEKLVMNRLYGQTFSPAIPPPAPLPGTKGKRKNMEKLFGPGRRGQHQEDIERDEILAQKVRIYGWVREEHLDIPPVGESGRRFLGLAQQELLKIKTYRAPRDKVICVLNCCKVIFGLLRNSKSADTSADSFVPLLIYVVLQANPEHLVSNIQYILRFRNQDKLGGEAGYYLSSLMGAIQFIESLDRTSLTVSDEEFEKNVEAAVSTIAEGHKEKMPQPTNHSSVNEKSAISQPEVTPRNSLEAEQSISSRSTSSREGPQSSATIEGTDDNVAVAGLLRTIQRPLSTIGRIFSDDGGPSHQPSSSGRSSTGPVSTPQSGTVRRLSPAVFQPPRSSSEGRLSNERLQEGEAVQSNDRLRAEDAAARQASAETAEAQRIQRTEHANVIETLAGMFPDLDREIIDDVVRMKEGRVGSAVDACLALSS